MPVPSPRNAVRPARGNFADLTSNVTSFKDGELCYAIDQDQLYINENGTLVAVGGAAGGTLGSLSDVQISAQANGDALIYNNGNWSNGGTLNGGAF